MPHRTIATISAGSAADAAQQLRRLPDDVQLAEVRLDALWPAAPDPERAADDLAVLLEASRTPLLATLRPKREGGAYDGPEDLRVNLLAAAAEAGFAAVDLENDGADMPALVRAMRNHAQELILSRHLFDDAPERDLAMRHLTSEQDLGADLHKLAFPTRTFPDCLRALELAYAHASRHGQPALAPMEAPLLIRAILPLAGNAATYGHAPGAPPAAPGQPGVDELLDLWRHWGLEATDMGPQPGGNRWLCVIGSPVAHSLSPRIHNAALRAAGNSARYGALDVPPNPGYLRLLFHVAGRLGLHGCSITSPHKLEAARLARSDDIATLLGAANCVRFTPQGPLATNTDATALHDLLQPHAGQATATAAVLGAGGAARAALWALQKLGFETTVYSRDPERGRAVASRFGAAWRPYAERDGAQASVWVQATPVGSRPGDPCPIASDALDQADAVLEMVYAAGTTELEKAARAAGCAVTSGRDVLLGQGVRAYQFWFDEEPDRAAMEAALLETAVAA